MAKMFPQRLLETPKSPAERKMFEKFKNQLSDDFTVFHSVAWLARSREGVAYDGETDFLIAHPELGILVLEVKGGQITFDGHTGAWFSTDRHRQTHQLSRDPITQVKDARYSLYRKLKNALMTKNYLYPICHAVCFPDTVIEQDIRLDLPAEIVLGRKEISDLERAIVRVFEYHGQRWIGQGVGSTGINALIKLLAPKVKLRSLMAVEFETEEEQIKQLTEQQFVTLDLLSRERRAIIYGCAGSGKTLLALEKANRLADEGYSVLLTCFNARLAEWVAQSPYNREEITVLHFHKLCFEMARKAGVTIPSLESELVQGDEKFFYSLVLPNALVEATMRLGPLYDATIVDEGQDFKQTWWEAIETLLVHRENAVFYIFCDDNQNIYAGAEQKYPFQSPSITLNRNCRNTRKIHGLVANYYRGNLPINAYGPEGRPPEIIQRSSKESDIELLRKCIHNLVQIEKVRPQDVVVLTPRAQHRSMFSQGARIGNLTLSWSLPAEPHQVLCSTIHSFKGLERPVVILAELDGLTESDRHMLLYIGLSRARNHLIILGELPR